MRRHEVVFAPEAEEQLTEFYRYIAEKGITRRALQPEEPED